MLSPTRPQVRRDGGLYTLERALRRRGFMAVAGADEAGRGACAGPLVAAAVVLPDRGEIEGLTDSKLLTAAARDRIYDVVLATAVSWAAIVVSPERLDERGLHVGNVAAMRRAIAALTPHPAYVLTDGFAVDGLGVPGLAIWKGDQVAACVAAASVVAKVTRDRMMTDLDAVYPRYGFAEHKGYSTPEHAAALRAHGPSPVHRLSYRNVAAAQIPAARVSAGPAPAARVSAGPAPAETPHAGAVLTARKAGRRGTVSSVDQQED